MVSMSTNFIVVVTFNTNPENHTVARTQIDDYIRDFLSQQPGFIESRLHELQAGAGLLHYASWQSENDFKLFALKAKDHPALPAIRAYTPSANFYHIFAEY